MNTLRDRVCDALAEGLPGYVPDTVRPLGCGVGNIAALVDQSLVVRFRLVDPTVNPAEDVAATAAEAALLRALGGLLSVPIPAVVFVHGTCLAYRRVPGEPLLHLYPGAPPDSGVRQEVIAELGRMLAELHRLAPEDLPGAGADPSIPRDYLPETEHWAGLLADELANLDDGGAASRQVREFLTAAAPEPAPASLFSHQDLGIEHILVAGGRVTGVIDWSDAAFGDPARDFGLLWRDLGRDAFDLLCRRYTRAGGPVPIDDEFVDRSRFVAVCGLLEDWVHGLTPGRERYADKSRARAAELLGSSPQA